MTPCQLVRERMVERDAFQLKKISFQKSFKNNNKKWLSHELSIGEYCVGWCRTGGRYGPREERGGGH